jgi:hypothetical protein
MTQHHQTSATRCARSSPQPTQRHKQKFEVDLLTTCTVHHHCGRFAAAYVRALASRRHREQVAAS